MTTTQTISKPRRERPKAVKLTDAAAERIRDIMVDADGKYQGVRVGVTAMVVSPPGAPVTPNADVSLELVSFEEDLVKVSTRAGSSSVTMVATDEEMHYIKASASLRD